MLFSQNFDEIHCTIRRLTALAPRVTWFAMNKLCFHHLSIAVDDLERARQFYTDVLEMQELDRPEGFGHPGIWYQIGDGQPQLHILVRPEATLRRDKWSTLPIFILPCVYRAIAIRYRGSTAKASAAIFQRPTSERCSFAPNLPRVTLKSTSSTPTVTSSNSTARRWIEVIRSLESFGRVCLTNTILTRQPVQQIVYRQNIGL